MDKDKMGSSSKSDNNKDASAYKKVQFLPIQIGPISTLEEMDMKVLQYQNKKLAQRIEDRRKFESELKQRIEQLEKRQTQDDAVLNVVNRYWNQLNEDIRILLLHFNAETTDESENDNECDTTKSFLAQLSSWDKVELDEKLASKVQVSVRAVAKIVKAFDHMLQRYNNIAVSLENNAGLDDVVKTGYVELQLENKRLHQLTTHLHEKNHIMSLKIHELEDRVNAHETETAELKNRLDDVEYERVKLQTRHNKLEHHLAEAVEKLKDYEHLCNSKKGTKSAVAPLSSNVNHKKIEELQEELEEQRELANSRLQELELTSQRLREALKEVEQLRTDLRTLPESIIVETTEYKTLQSQFSVLYNESMQMRTQLEETHNQLQNIKGNHSKHVEMMEMEDLMGQKKLRADLLQAEDRLSQVCKEYELLKTEYEQVVVANEQSGPLNREMRHLINSLQSHNMQLKNELCRYKRKYKDTGVEYLKLKKELDEMKTKLLNTRNSNENIKDVQNHHGASQQLYQQQHGSAADTPSGLIKDEHPSSSGATEADEDDKPHSESAANDCSEKSLESTTSFDSGDKQKKKIKKTANGSSDKKDADGKSSSSSSSSAGKHKEEVSPAPPSISAGAASSCSENEIKELKNSLRKAINDTKELKLLLDMYKNASKEQRDKALLMASEKKLKTELEDIKQQLRKLQENKRADDRKKVSDEEAARRIKFLEDQVQTLHNKVTKFKQEEQASLSEMEVTGQAYEDMQDMNYRLIQQLHEKDDANFKLMTERIKVNQIHKNIKDEKDALQELVTHLNTQMDSTNMIVRKLEEKERLMQQCVGNVEKELGLCRQALEMYKRKAIESAQSASDLKMHLEKYHAQMKEAQQIVSEKTSALESEAYKTNRLQEEIAQMKRKIERMKKLEAAETMDAVLMEEIREYKETLTCPSCKVQRKDAVLIKCFHVFCFDCLRTRYETRQRKCPKCNAAFGANDYRRLYLGN